MIGFSTTKDKLAIIKKLKFFKILKELKSLLGFTSFLYYNVLGYVMIIEPL